MHANCKIFPDEKLSVLLAVQLWWMWYASQTKGKLPFAQLFSSFAILYLHIHRFGKANDISVEFETFNFVRLTKSAILATWMTSCTTSARVLPLRFSNIDRSITSAVSIYLVASRTSRFMRPAPFEWCSSTSSGRKPDICFWRLIPIRFSNELVFAHPLFDLVRASNITCGCFCEKEAKKI